MSRIVSPHAPARFVVDIDKQTGAAAFTPSEPIDFLVIMQAFSAITLQMIEENKSRGAFPVSTVGPKLDFLEVLCVFESLKLQIVQDFLKAKAAGCYGKNPFGNPQENPAGKMERPL